MLVQTDAAIALHGIILGFVVVGFIPLVLGGLGAYAGLKALFGGGDDKKKKADDEQRAEVDPYLKQLQGGANMLGQQSQSLSNMGAEGLSPAVQHIKQMLSSNPAELMAATAPERGRVIDQYDTARQAIGQFGPRGGGTTSALAQSRVSEAGDLADVVNMGKRDAVGQAAQIGTTLTGLGLSAEQLKTMDLNAILDVLLTQQGFDITKRGQTMDMWSGLGQGAGSIVGGIFAGRGD